MQDRQDRLGSLADLELLLGKVPGEEKQKSAALAMFNASGTVHVELFRREFLNVEKTLDTGIDHYDLGPIMLEVKP